MRMSFPFPYIANLIILRFITITTFYNNIFKPHQEAKKITLVCSFVTSRHLSAAPREVLAMLILPPFKPDMAILNPSPKY